MMLIVVKVKVIMVSETSSCGCCGIDCDRGGYSGRGGNKVNSPRKGCYQRELWAVTKQHPPRNLTPGLFNHHYPARRETEALCLSSSP